MPSKKYKQDRKQRIRSSKALKATFTCDVIDLIKITLADLNEIKNIGLIRNIIKLNSSKQSSSAISDTSSTTKKTIKKPIRENVIEFPMAIIPVDYPITTITAGQADVIKEFILKQIDDIPEGNDSPKFTNASLCRDYLVVNCLNLFSSNWLERIITECEVLGRTRIKVVAESDVCKIIYSMVLIPRPITSLETILRRLHLQNSDITITTSWKLIHTVKCNESSTQRMFIAMDLPSWQSLVKKNCSLFFNISQVRFNLIDKKKWDAYFRIYDILCTDEDWWKKNVKQFLAPVCAKPIINEVPSKPSARLSLIPIEKLMKPESPESHVTSYEIETVIPIERQVTSNALKEEIIIPIEELMESQVISNQPIETQVTSNELNEGIIIPIEELMEEEVELYETEEPSPLYEDFNGCETAEQLWEKVFTELIEPIISTLEDEVRKIVNPQKFWDNFMEVIYLEHSNLVNARSVDPSDIIETTVAGPSNILQATSAVPPNILQNTSNMLQTTSSAHMQPETLIDRQINKSEPNSPRGVAGTNAISGSNSQILNPGQQHKKKPTEPVETPNALTIPKSGLQAHIQSLLKALDTANKPGQSSGTSNHRRM